MPLYFFRAISALGIYAYEYPTEASRPLHDTCFTNVIECAESHGKIQTGVSYGPPYGTDTRYPDRSQGDADRIRHITLKETP
jgi:hypothetical protein